MEQKAAFTPLQFSIGTLLAIVFLIAVCLAIVRAYDRWYAHRYSAHYMFSLLHHQIRNGDTFQDVARYFDTAVKTDRDAPNVQKIWSQRSWVIQPGDEIWHFGMRSSGVYLQFRDGRVVNHVNSDYVEADRMAQLNHQPVPPLVSRFGPWPLCFMVLGGGGCILVMLDNRARNLKRLWA
jgi:hypothetical protein